MSNREIRVYDTVAELQEAAADYVGDKLRTASPSMPVRIALSGGSTPRRMHQLLAATPDVQWEHVHVYFGDERTVGPEDAQSNYRMACDTLLDLVPIPPVNVHRMRGEDDPTAAARAYADELWASFGRHHGEWPRFDLVILGMGADGHTASLFPGTDALQERDELVVSTAVPQLDTVRITLTYPVLNAAAAVLFLAAGADKAPAIAAVFGTDEAARPPAAFVLPIAGTLLWMLDAAAAAGLPATH